MRLLWQIRFQRCHRILINSFNMKLLAFLLGVWRKLIRETKGGKLATVHIFVFNDRVLFKTFKYVPDDIIKWKHFQRYWPFVRGIHRSPVNSPHKGQWREALVFSLICTQINGWVNNGEAGDLRRHRAHYDVNVMYVCEYTTYHVTFRHCCFRARFVLRLHVNA